MKKEILKRKVEEIIFGERITAAEFARVVGLTSPQLSKFRNTESTFSRNTINRIKAAYPDYFKNDVKTFNGNNMKVPLVSQQAQAGYSAGIEDDHYVEDLPTMYVPRETEKGNYLVFEIKGDSMDYGPNAIREYDKVLAKELPSLYWNNKLHYNRYVFIIVVDDGLMCKQIIDHNTVTGDIVCHSFNPFYEDFTLNLGSVRQLFYVKRIVDRNITL